MKAFIFATIKRSRHYRRASDAWRWIEPRLTRSARSVTRRDHRLVANYLRTQDRPKLHIGCGDNHLDGWLNTELCPRGEQIYLDATEPFPLPGDTFAFVYSEHMIEHIPYQDALRMLGESFRILRPGGIIRIVTPNLRFLTTLVDGTRDSTTSAYVDYSFAAHEIGGPARSGAHLVNHFMRAWGHQFIYDLESLSGALADTGFEEISARALADSDHPELRGLAKVDRMPTPFLEMESIVIEGRKPIR